tara:strand:+ start:98 stop:508 length:411 start_codon:yes stop_codon:yes gene_type:complete
MNTIRSSDVEDEEIIIIAEMEVNIDQLSEVRDFCKFYSLIVMENEPDVHEWKFFLNEEAKTVTLVERYKDSEALINHGVNISIGGILEKHFQQFMRIFNFKKIKVLGECSEELIKSHEKIDLNFDYSVCAGGSTRI